MNYLCNDGKASDNVIHAFEHELSKSLCTVVNAQSEDLFKPWDHIDVNVLEFHTMLCSRLAPDPKNT